MHVLFGRLIMDYLNMIGEKWKRFGLNTQQHQSVVNDPCFGYSVISYSQILARDKVGRFSWEGISKRVDYVQLIFLHELWQF